MIRFRFIQRYRLSYWCRYPLVEAQVTTVPPRLATYTLAPNVSRPGCSNTMSGSSPPVSSRLRPPNGRPSPSSWVGSPPQTRSPSAARSMPSSAPIRWHSSAFSGLDTTQTGTPPPLSTNWVAYEPRPPEAPQISTTSPCFSCAPWCETSWRYAVEFTSPGQAASSQLRCAGLGISWLALTRASSARPPKFVSKPQIRCCGSSIVSSCPAASSSSTDRQCATTSSPGFHLVTPGPTRRTTPAASEPTTWYGRSCRRGSSESPPERSREREVEIGSKRVGPTPLYVVALAITPTQAPPPPPSRGGSPPAGTHLPG